MKNPVRPPLDTLRRLNREYIAAYMKPDVAAYRLANVRVRLYGGVALVQATGRFTRPDGRRGTSRYTDVYVRRNGTWKVVSAQITRTADAT